MPSPAPSVPAMFSLLRPVLRVAAILIAAGAVVAPQARAQAMAEPAADLGGLTQRWLDDALARNQPEGMPLRMEVSVGTLDSRLRLAPCARVEPYLPAGSRLWGPHASGAALRRGRHGMERIFARHRQGFRPRLGAEQQCGSRRGLDGGRRYRGGGGLGGRGRARAGQPRPVGGVGGVAPVDGRPALCASRWSGRRRFSAQGAGAGDYAGPGLPGHIVGSGPLQWGIGPDNSHPHG